MPSGGERRGGLRRTVYMHRQLVGARSGEQVDHRDGDGLNNRRANLRGCNQSQNFANRVVLPVKVSPYRGVYPARNGRGWRAQAKARGHTVHLGTFTTPEAAARAYDCFAVQTWGEFARPNFSPRG